MSFSLGTIGPPAGHDGAVPAVEVQGDVDATNAAELRAALTDLAAPSLIVDLSAVEYFDSAAFAMIDDLLGRAQVAIVVQPGSVVRTAAALMNIPVHDSLAAAQAALGLA